MMYLVPKDHDKEIKMRGESDYPPYNPHTEVLSYIRLRVAQMIHQRTLHRQYSKYHYHELAGEVMGFLNVAHEYSLSDFGAAYLAIEGLEDGNWHVSLAKDPAL